MKPTPTLKKSKQRDAIITFLQGRKDHPTADTIYHGLRETFPNISLGTVYRNLSLLSDLGMILKLSYGDHPDRFDADVSTHYHFMCKHCGNVSDLEMVSIEFINEIAGQNFNGKIEGNSTFFFGTCVNCLEEEGK